MLTIRGNRHGLNRVIMPPRFHKEPKSTSPIKPRDDADIIVDLKPIKPYISTYVLPETETTKVEEEWNP